MANHFIMRFSHILCHSTNLYRFAQFTTRATARTCQFPKENLTAVLRSVDNLVLESRPMPQIEDGEVLLAIDCVGISHTDVHYWKHGRLGPFTLVKPMVVGHEASGIVAAVGNNVCDLCVGDRVAIEPGVPCRKCAFCKSGRYNLCENMRFCAEPPVDGNLACYFKHAADFCYKLPDHVTMEEGALLCTLASACAACRRANLQSGMNLLILGASAVGLATLMVAQSVGVNNIMITDDKAERLALAKELGASATLRSYADESPTRLGKRIVAAFDCMPERTIDCCGTLASAQLGMLVTRSGGVFTLVMLSNDSKELALLNALAREVDLVCVYRFCNDYAHALALVASGKVQLKRLVSHGYTLKELNAAFQRAYADEPATIKVLVHVQPRNANNFQQPLEEPQMQADAQKCA